MKLEKLLQIHIPPTTINSMIVYFLSLGTQKLHKSSISFQKVLFLISDFFFLILISDFTKKQDH